MGGWYLKGEVAESIRQLPNDTKEDEGTIWRDEIVVDNGGKKCYK